MRTVTVLISVLVLFAAPTTAIEFLGVELCKGSTDTGIRFAPGSSLVLESVEIGDHGGLVMLLSARSGRVMNHVDDLMTGLTGERGQGDDETLEWSGGRLTGVAQRVAKKYAALAVTSTDDCAAAGPAPAPVSEEPIVEPSAVDPAPSGSDPGEPAPDLLPEPVAATAATTAVAAATTTSPPTPEREPEPVQAPKNPSTSDFDLIGELSHEAADRTWVDVMGVVANHTGESYKLATFDLSFFASDGSLICVDTISVSVLKAGQERAFRDAIRCPGYDAGEVAESRLQFAGGF
jgi:hypothetical protein